MTEMDRLAARGVLTRLSGVLFPSLCSPESVKGLSSEFVCLLVETSAKQQEEK